MLPASSFSIVGDETWGFGCGVDSAGGVFVVSGDGRVCDVLAGRGDGLDVGF